MSLPVANLFFSLLVALLVAQNASANDATTRRTSDKPAQTRTTRPSEAVDLATQNPFAARANRTSLRQEAPTIAPRARKAETNDLDVIALRDGGKIEGAITRFSGADGVTIMRDEREERVEFARIERLDAAVSRSFLQGTVAFDAGRRSGLESEFRRALALFKEARASADRSFEKEWATARIVETLLALGRQDEAVVEFFILCRIDPYVAFLPSIPLQWRNQRSSTLDANAIRNAQEAAVPWLNARDNPTGAPNPVGRLLAASTLMRSSRHGASATAALQELVTLEPPEGASADAIETCRVVSLLAMAQLWRDDVLKNPEQKTVERWRRALELLPNAYKPGPSALIALGEKSLGDDAAAARSFMLAGTLTNDRELARECVKECADAFERQGENMIAEELRASLAKETAN